MKFSDLEIAILKEIQRDTSVSLADIAEAVGAGQSTVWRKLADMDAAGVIKRRVAILDPMKTGLGLCIFATVSLRDHSEASVNAFARIVRSHPEVQECHAITGSADYMVKIRVADVAAYERFMTYHLLRSDVVQSVHSSFSLKQLKDTTELPL